MSMKRRLRPLLPNLLRVLSTLASYILGSALSVLFGFSPLPNSPLLDVLRFHWVGLAITAGALGATIALSLLALKRVKFDRSAGRAALRFLSSTVTATAVSAALGVVLGFGSFTAHNPALDLLRVHPFWGMLLLLAPLLLIIFAPLLALRETRASLRPEQRSRLAGATTVSVVSALLFTSLLATVVTRPAWCPSAVCPAPVSVLVTNPNGAHDANLEAYFTAVEASAYVIEGSPSDYALGHLPGTIGAIRADTTSYVYKAVVGVHSLRRQGPYSVIIDRVAIRVDAVASVPQPLDVYLAGEQLDYHSQPFAVHYLGQTAGAVLPAAYQPLPGGHVQLKAGECDELDIGIVAHAPAMLTFHVQVAYELGDTLGASHTLTLPHPFQLAIGGSSNWHPYTLQGENLAPRL